MSPPIKYTSEQLAARCNAYGNLITGDVLTLDVAAAQVAATSPAERMDKLISGASQVTEGNWYRLLGEHVLSCDVQPHHLGELRDIITINTRRDNMMTEAEQERLFDGCQIPTTLYRLTTQADANADALVWYMTRRAVRKAAAASTSQDKVIVRAELPSEEILALKYIPGDKEPRLIVLSARITALTVISTPLTC